MSHQLGPPAGPESPGWSGGPAGQAPTLAPLHAYGRLSGLAGWTAGLLMTVAVADLVVAAVSITVFGLDPRVVEPGRDFLSGGELATTMLDLLRSLLYLAAVVLFFVWFYRAYRNLTALGAGELRYGAGWAIGAWFVPILNLIRPKRMANDIWRASDPELAAGAAWRGGVVPRFHSAWWAAWVGLWVLALVGVVEMILAAENLDDLQPSGAVALAQNLLDAVAAILAALVVRRTSTRQEERFRRLTGAGQLGSGAAWTTA